MIGKAEYNETNSLLSHKLDKHGVLIAVHRGSSGGNIVDNTIPAYKAALQQGGDILEIDVIKSVDGILYIFHDGMEEKLLHRSENIKTMYSAEIENLNLINSNYAKSSYKVERFEEVLSYFKGEVLINIDRAWDIWPELLETLDKHNMQKQILLKSPVLKESLQFLNQYKTKYMFMPIVYSLEEIEIVLNYENLNLVGMELIADSESHPLFQDDVIERLHNMKLFVWANAINLDNEIVLFARLDDDTSLIHNPDQGWGRLFEKKIDIIQTDWPSLLATYRNLGKIR
jgi:glycerophosphoryl diester phosphodiesterase